MDERQRVFRRAVVALVLFGGAVTFLLVGDTPGIDPGRYKVGWQDIDLLDLRPAEPVDSIEYRYAAAYDEGFEPLVLDEPHLSAGEPCSGAEDLPVCQEAYEQALQSEPEPAYSEGCGPMQPCDPVFLIVTRHDEVSAIGKAELLTFLGTIDTFGESALVLGKKASWRRTNDGLEYVDTVVVEDCDPVVEDLVVGLVKFSGEVVELDREEISRSYGVCI